MNGVNRPQTTSQLLVFAQNEPATYSAEGVVVVASSSDGGELICLGPGRPTKLIKRDDGKKVIYFNCARRTSKLFGRLNFVFEVGRIETPTRRNEIGKILKSVNSENFLIDSPKRGVCTLFFSNYKVRSHEILDLNGRCTAYLHR